MDFCQSLAELETGVKNPSVAEYIIYKHKCLEFPVKVRLSPDIANHPKYGEIVKDIKESLEEGKGLSMYLSKQAKHLKYDGMYEDFGILHLHLNKKIGNRIIDTAHNSGTTLQLYYYKGVAYIFNFGRHGMGAYTNTNDMQKLYNLFPEALKNRMLHDDHFTKELHNVSSQERFHLRKSGGATTTDIFDKDGFAKSLFPAGVFLFLNENILQFRLNTAINDEFIKLQNLICSLGFKDIIVRKEFDTKEFKILDQKSYKLVYSFNNDNFIKLLIE